MDPLEHASGTTVFCSRIFSIRLSTAYFWNDDSQSGTPSCGYEHNTVFDTICADMLAREEVLFVRGEREKQEQARREQERIDNGVIRFADTAV